MSSRTWKAGLAGVAIIAVVATASYAVAQTAPDHMQGMHGQMPADGQGQNKDQQQMSPHGGMGGMGGMRGSMRGQMLQMRGQMLQMRGQMMQMQGQMMQMHGGAGQGMQGLHGGMQGGMQGGMDSHGMMDQEMQGGMQGMHGGMQGGRNPHAMMRQRGAMSGQPAVAGQDAFGIIQEVVQILEADPNTDWSKVNIAALREHLIDMNEVTLRAAASERVLDDGIEITVIGEGRSLAAIKSMIPEHARMLAETGWNAKTEDLPNGVKLVVTTTDKAQVPILKALGFMGIMVQGEHHQSHHLMIAKGEFPPH